MLSHTTIAFTDASTVRDFTKTLTDVDNEIQLELPTATVGDDVDLGSIYGYVVIKTSGGVEIEPKFTSTLAHYTTINVDTDTAPILLLDGMYTATAGSVYEFEIKCKIGDYAST